MAITSSGYEGTVDYADWAQMASHMGGSYSVFGVGSFALTPGAGDREVVLAEGRAAGAGIQDDSSTPVTLAGAVVTSGSRWDMVVLRREWGVVNASSLVLIQGGSTKALPTRNTTPGTLDDQPLWLVRFTAGQTAVQEIVDLRVWRGDGGVTANDILVLDYLNREGSTVRVGGAEWARVLVAGVPTWVDFADWGRVANKPSTFTPSEHTHDRLVSGTSTFRLGSDSNGPFVRADGTLVWGRTYDVVSPGSTRLLVMTNQGTMGALSVALPTSAGGTGATSTGAALKNLGVYAGDFNGQSLNAGATKTFTLPLPGTPGSWIVVPSVSNPNLTVEWSRLGGSVTVEVANPTGSTRSYSLGWVAVRSNT